MLIRNVKSRQDLENKLKQQAELLQTRINNEALLESVMKDYKNPYKPQALPPQYKTNNEIMRDSLTQQKEAIENIKSLGIDFSVASQITQDLTKLPDGDANIIKLNKNFPFIKKDITKKYNPKYLDSSIIIEYLKEYFAEIDSAIGVNIADEFVSKTPMNAYEKIPSSGLLATLNNEIKRIITDFVLQDVDELTNMVDHLEKMINVSPLGDELKAIDNFPIIERQRLNKQVSRLLTTYKIPSADTIIKILKGLDRDSGQGVDPSLMSSNISISQPDQTETIKNSLAILKNLLGHVSQVSLKNLEEFTNNIRSEIKTISGIESKIPSLGDEEIAIRTNVNKVHTYLTGKINTLGRENIVKRITDEKTGYTTKKGNTYLNQVATIDGNPPNKEHTNVIFELVNKGDQRGAHFVDTLKMVDKNDNMSDIDKSVVIDVDFDRFLKIARLSVRQDGKYDLILPGSPGHRSSEKDRRYTIGQLNKIVQSVEGDKEKIREKVESKHGYDPENVMDDRLIESQGFGLSKKIIKHFKKDEKEMMRLKKAYDKHLYNEEKVDKGFMSRKIKLGKGISIPKDEPKFKEFGKFIINYRQLMEDNVLNLRYPSMGNIPSIKPVNVDENYKEFIIDVLENGKVNKRHYQTLTETEKQHFSKIARMAKVLDVIGFKPDTDGQEDKDMKRLEILLGEVNAGNDNEKILKECKMLIKKYVANGRIDKNKGLQLLMDLE